MRMKYVYLGLLACAFFKVSWSFLFPQPLPRTHRLFTATSASTGQTIKERNVELNPYILQFDYLNEEKLPWSPSGYHSWNWRGYKINYVHLGGEDKSDQKPPLVLIHGFGASVYHWRYNLPVLARKFNVFAIDLLGFGLSDKPILDYTADIWRDQVLDFTKEVVLPFSHNQPCVIAGNSLGGFTALYAASDSRAVEEQLFNGCILLNAAGSFRPLDGSIDKPQSAIMRKVTEVLQRFVVSLSFIYTKQPTRIEQVLKQVYPVNRSAVDRELVASIEHPTQHDNAAEVFYRMVSRNGAGPTVYVDDLLVALKVPMLLLWGIHDPWIRPKNADRIQELFPGAQRVDVLAGHCPHDEAPYEVNAAIDSFVSQLAELRNRL